MSGLAKLKSKIFRRKKFHTGPSNVPLPYEKMSNKHVDFSLFKANSAGSLNCIFFYLCLIVSSYLAYRRDKSCRRICSKVFFLLKWDDLCEWMVPPVIFWEAHFVPNVWLEKNLPFLPGKFPIFLKLFYNRVKNLTMGNSKKKSSSA